MANSFLSSASSTSSTKKNNSNIAKKTSGYYKANNFSVEDIYNNLMSNSGVSSTGGAYRPDTSAAIAAYNKAADANRAIAKSNYDTTREDLLTQLNRFKESNEKSRTNQKQSYLTNQSAIDTAKEQANRESKISSAARGLGSSGLQNLAEIQNDLGVQSDISKLANENQSVLDDLATQLKQQEEDTNTGLKNAETTYNNTLKSIASDLASKIAQVNYDADQVYNTSLANASSNYASAAANARSLATQMYSLLNNSSSGLINQIQNMSKKDLANYYGVDEKDASLANIANAMYNTYKTQLDSLSQQGLDSNIYAQALKNLTTTTNTYKKYGR
jgi:hypothetical protein